MMAVKKSMFNQNNLSPEAPKTSSVRSKFQQLMLKRQASKIFAPSELVHLEDEVTGTSHVFRRYARRGHMPPIMRRPSFYEKIAAAEEEENKQAD